MGNVLTRLVPTLYLIARRVDLILKILMEFVYGDLHVLV